MEQNVLEQALSPGQKRKLIDKVLRKQLLEELAKKGLRYSDVRDQILNGDYKVSEESTYIVPDFRAGKVTFSTGDFNMFSFFKVPFSNKKRAEVLKDFAVSNYLSGKGVKVPQTVFRTKRFTATELIQGQGLADYTGSRSLEDITDETLGEIFKYHSLDPTKIKKQVSGSFRDFYGIESFARKANLTLARGDYLQESWGILLDRLGQQKQGLIHNDLHEGNLFVNGDVNIIDWGDATMGPVHIDIVRHLMSTGFYQDLRQKKMDAFYEGKRVNMGEEVAKRVALPPFTGYNEENFQRSANLAYAFTRLRLASSNASQAIKMENDAAFHASLSSRQRQLLSGLPAYHFSCAIDALEEEGFHEFATGLQDIVSNGPLQYQDHLAVLDFIDEFSPDTGLLEEKKKINETLGLVDRERAMQDNDLKKLKRGRIARSYSMGLTTLAVLVAGGIGGSAWHYDKNLKHLDAEVDDRRKVLGELKNNYDNFFRGDFMLSFSPSPAGIRYVGDVDDWYVRRNKTNIETFMISTKRPIPEHDSTRDRQLLLNNVKSLPNILTALYVPENKELFFRRWEEFLEREPEYRQDTLQECLKEPGFSECVATGNLSATDMECSNFGRGRFLSHLAFKPFFNERKLTDEFLDSLDMLYFRVPGVMSSLFEFDAPRSKRSGKELGVYQVEGMHRYPNSTPFRFQKAAAALVESVKETNNLAFAIENTFCNHYDGEVTEQRFLRSTNACRDGYFRFLGNVGISPEFLEPLQEAIQKQITEERRFPANDKCMLLTYSNQPNLKYDWEGDFPEFMGELAENTADRAAQLIIAGAGVERGFKSLPVQCRGKVKMPTSEEFTSAVYARAEFFMDSWMYRARYVRQGADKKAIQEAMSCNFEQVKSTVGGRMYDNPLMIRMVELREYFARQITIEEPWVQRDAWEKQSNGANALIAGADVCSDVGLITPTHREEVKDLAIEYQSIRRKLSSEIIYRLQDSNCKKFSAIYK